MFTQELINYEFGAVQINDVNDVWMYTAETFFRCRSVFYSLKQTKLRSNLRPCSPHLISNFCCFLEQLILSDKVKYRNMIKSWRNNA